MMIDSVRMTGRALYRTHFLLQPVLLALALLLPGMALAQQPPDAGSLLQQQPKPPQTKTPPATVPTIEQPAPKTGAAGPKVKVREFRVRGNTLISDKELLKPLHGLIGKKVTFQQLQNAALTLTGYYAQKGYIARVFLPPQDIKDGVVEFQVVEGVRGKVKLERQGQRVDGDRVRRFIEQRLSAGAPMDINKLGEALNIVNEQPGVDARATLTPGSTEGAIDLNITAADRPLFNYSLSANNQGSRGTGVWQGSAGMTINNPTGHFDAGSVFFNKSDGSLYGYVDYSLAVGERGLRLGMNISGLRYRVVQGSFAALKSKGTAYTLGLTASYPIARRTAFNLGLTASVAHKRLIDRTVAGQIGDRQLNVGTLGVNGYRYLDSRFINGMLSFGADLTVGDVDQHNAGALAIDQATRRTQGSFVKIGGNLALMRPLDENWTVSAGLLGQLASTNLDSSERMFLGGPNGVRAYAWDQSQGDDGWLANLTLTRRLGNRLTAAGFVEAGGVRINHTLPSVLANQINYFTLQDIGLDITWQPLAQSIIYFALAVPLGYNQSGTIGVKSKRPRLWANFTTRF